MIDWVGVAFSSLWIAGLALILAAVSYYYWLAKEESMPIGSMFQQPAFLRFVYAGLLLIAVGLLGTSANLVESFLAVLLIGLSGYGLMKLYRQTRENRQ